jgi:tetratricopeptide (TPR) repeat protein
MGPGNPQTALELQREAVWLCAEFKMPIPTAEHRASLGNMLAHIGQRQEALQNLRQAGKVFRDFGLVGPLGSCLGQMANVFAAQREPHEAYRLNEEALGLLRGAGQHVWLATCLLNQAGICLGLGRYQDGKGMAEEALEEIRLCSAPPPIRQTVLQVLFELRQRAARGR